MNIATLDHSDIRNVVLRFDVPGFPVVTVEAPARGKTLGVTFLLSPGFCLFSVSAAMEAFGTANRLAGREAYRWRFVSVDDRQVESDAGIAIECGTDIALDLHGIGASEPADIVFVASDRPASPAVMGRVKRYLHGMYQRGARIVGTGRGALLLAEAGFLDGRRCAVHWQHLPEFDQRYPKADVDCHLYESSGRVITCAGQTASLDLAMNLVRQDLGADIALQLCNHHVVEQVRPARHRQRRPDTSSIEITNPRLGAAIALMKANLAEPLPLVQLARRIGMSRRQVERLFEFEGQQAPARFYLHVRLEQAQKLLQTTDLPIVDIGKTCGFISASHFSKCYRKRFGHSPKREREQDED